MANFICLTWADIISHRPMNGKPAKISTTFLYESKEYKRYRLKVLITRISFYSKL